MVAVELRIWPASELPSPRRSSKLHKMRANQNTSFNLLLPERFHVSSLALVDLIILKKGRALKRALSSFLFDLFSSLAGGGGTPQQTTSWRWWRAYTTRILHVLNYTSMSTRFNVKQKTKMKIITFIHSFKGQPSCSENSSNSCFPLKKSPKNQPIHQKTHHLRLVTALGHKADGKTPQLFSVLQFSQAPRVLVEFHC